MFQCDFFGMQKTLESKWGKDRSCSDCTVLFFSWAKISGLSETIISWNAENIGILQCLEPRKKQKKKHGKTAHHSPVFWWTLMKNIYGRYGHVHAVETFIKVTIQQDQKWPFFLKWVSWILFESNHRRVDATKTYIRDHRSMTNDLDIQRICVQPQFRSLFICCLKIVKKSQKEVPFGLSLHSTIHPFSGFPSESQWYQRSSQWTCRVPDEVSYVRGE